MLNRVGPAVVVLKGAVHAGGLPLRANFSPFFFFFAPVTHPKYCSRGIKSLPLIRTALALRPVMNMQMKKRDKLATKDPSIYPPLLGLCRLDCVPASRLSQKSNTPFQGWPWAGALGRGPGSGAL